MIVFGRRQTCAWTLDSQPVLAAASRQD